MKTITVRIDALRKALLENSKAHRQTFEEAWTKYRAAVIENMERNLDSAKKGGPIHLALYMETPLNHSDDYNTALAMLDMAVGETIEISREDFAHYVLDNWGWKKHWAETTSSYLND